MFTRRNSWMPKKKEEKNAKIHINGPYASIDRHHYSFVLQTTQKQFNNFCSFSFSHIFVDQCVLDIVYHGSQHNILFYFCFSSALFIRSLFLSGLLLAAFSIISFTPYVCTVFMLDCCPFIGHWIFALIYAFRSIKFVRKWFGKVFNQWSLHRFQINEYKALLFPDD